MISLIIIEIVNAHLYGCLTQYHKICQKGPFSQILSHKNYVLKEAGLSAALPVDVLPFSHCGFGGCVLGCAASYHNYCTHSRPVDPRTIPSSPWMSKLLVLDHPGIQADHPRLSLDVLHLSIPYAVDTWTVPDYTRTFNVPKPTPVSEYPGYRSYVDSPGLNRDAQPAPTNPCV